MGTVWGAYVPNWITAAGALIAVIGVIAAWRALRADADRERRRKAEGLSAWWAVRGGQWGVLIHNATDATFHDITVTARGGHHAHAGQPIPVRVLPPGDCFVTACRPGTSYPWEIEEQDAEAPTQPVMYSSSHGIVSISFTDAAGHKWAWEPDRGLVAA